MDFKKSNRDNTRINEWIRAEKVLVIDQEGKNLGELSRQEAIRLAQDAELDLVEVGPTSQPPVCRIMNYSRYIYEQNKKMKKNKATKAKDQKEFRFSTVIDQGDKNTKIRRAHEFLEKNYPVRITVQRKGRQTYEQALSVFNDILTNFTEYSTIEPELKSEGNRISITFKKNGTSKNKQNSNKENKAIQSKGQQEGQNDV
ncbi:MAG: translation initiation factor IF-3 [Candidatus Dojkabacteria bacterium]|jgi:translation initiation factor IF-3